MWNAMLRVRDWYSHCVLDSRKWSLIFIAVIILVLIYALKKISWGAIWKMHANFKNYSFYFILFIFIFYFSTFGAWGMGIGYGSACLSWFCPCGLMTLFNRTELKLKEWLDILIARGRMLDCLTSSLILVSPVCHHCSLKESMGDLQKNEKIKNNIQWDQLSVGNNIIVLILLLSWWISNEYALEFFSMNAISFMTQNMHKASST